MTSTCVESRPLRDPAVLPEQRVFVFADALTAPGGERHARRSYIAKSLYC